MKFIVTVFPASDGDCILVSYGSTPVRHVLVDGGRTSTYASLKPALQNIIDAGERLELLVLSHIDADHIEGLLSLLADHQLNLEINEVWFNGYDQLVKLERLGPGQGDRFSKALKDRGLKANARFSGEPIMIPDNGLLAEPILLEGGLSLTLLSPDKQRLLKLESEWTKWREARSAPPSRKHVPAPIGLEILGRKPMPQLLDIDSLADAMERRDTETPNGSSIAFIAEFLEKRVLFAADAHPDMLTNSISKLLLESDNRYRMDVVKVAHHGSIGNTSRALIKILDCRRFIFSSDGSRHGHPDPESLAKILKYASAEPKAIYFNYETDQTMPWNNKALKNHWNYECHFAATDAPLVIDV